MDQEHIKKNNYIKTKENKEIKDYSKYFKKESSLPEYKKQRIRKKEEINYINEFNIDASLINLGKNKTYNILTFGCQMNEHDSEVMSGLLEAIGFTKTNDKFAADVVILNTCAIRENAELKVFGIMGEYKQIKKENPNMILALAGCMAQEETVVKKVLKSYNWVDLIFGTHNIHNLPNYIKDAMFSKEMVIEVWNKEGDIIENMPKVRKGKIKAWVNIMYGCDKFCTYCIVPYTRGKERSRMPKDIINEVKELKKQGYKEVTLLGQNVNAYGKDLKDIDYNLGKLLKEIADINIPRIRFTTSHPWDFDDDLIDAFSYKKNIMPHLHLPVQSGSNKVLKKMNRNYTRESYLELIDKFKKANPNVSITTDIIVAFPNETDEDFEKTLSLVDYVDYEGAFTFIFSPRKGTPAEKFKNDIPIDVKKERLNILNEKINKGYLKGNKKMENQVVKVLVEGVSKGNKDNLAGYTENLKLINFPGDESLVGQIIDVKVTKAKTWSLDGEIVR